MPVYSQSSLSIYNQDGTFLVVYRHDLLDSNQNKVE